MRRPMGSANRCSLIMPACEWWLPNGMRAPGVRAARDCRLSIRVPILGPRVTEVEGFRTLAVPGTWQAFTRFAVEGRPAAQVAAELGVTESAVVQAKFRILKRLREEAGELLD